jgi:hypothetical protein
VSPPPNTPPPTLLPNACSHLLCYRLPAWARAHAWGWGGGHACRSRGIGAATALHLAAAGIKVVLAARSMDALESVKAKIEAAGGAASVIKCDVTDPKQVAAVFEHATSTYGGVDFVCAFRRQ